MLNQDVSKYGLATHLALAAALPAALAQFLAPEALACVTLWVSAFAFIWLLVEPSVMSGETVSSARRRVIRGIIRDPFSWFLAVVTVIAFSRWLNSGVRLVFDAEVASWSVKEPVVPFLPASNGNAALLPLALAVVSCPVVLGLKHALGRNGRLWFGVMSGAISSTGALAAVICAGLGIQPFAGAAVSSFGAESFPGAMYALFLAIAVVCGVESEERGMTKSRLVFAWAVAGNAVGAYVFLPTILSISYLAIAGLLSLIAFFMCNCRAGVAATARAASMFFFGVIAAMFIFMVLPTDDIQAAKIKDLEVEKAFPPALADRNEALRRIANAMWIQQPWTGVGIGAFSLHAPFCAAKEDWAVLPAEPKNGSNGYFTLLAERGIVGGLIWIIGIGFLCWFWIARLVGAFLWQKGQDEGRSFLRNISAVVWAGPIVLCECAVDAWFSSGYPLTPLYLCVVAAMPLAGASFPKVKRKTLHEEDKKG